MAEPQLASDLNKKYLIVILGPTASGKTGLSLQLARHFKAPVLSSDSRQFYRQMTIGTAKPTEGELKAAKHYFINSLDVWEEYNAGAYERDALKVLESIYREKNVAIVTGGSTLYLKALLEGMDSFPEISPATREQVQKLYKEQGLKALQQALEKADPAYYAAVDRQNPQRLMRALEVCITSGKPYSSFRKAGKAARPFTAIKLGLHWPRQQLYGRIEQRCDEMLAAGLAEEVKSLQAWKHLNALQTVGYSEFFDWMEGKYSYEEAVALFKQHTRNYAKRQLTWFRRDEEIHWLNAAGGNLLNEALAAINLHMAEGKA